MYIRWWRTQSGPKGGSGKGRKSKFEKCGCSKTRSGHAGTAIEIPYNLVTRAIDAVEDVDGGVDQPPVERAQDDKVKVMVRDPSSAYRPSPMSRVATDTRVQQKNAVPEHTPKQNTGVGGRVKAQGPAWRTINCHFLLNMMRVQIDEVTALQISEISTLEARLAQLGRRIYALLFIINGEEIVKCPFFLDTGADLNVCQDGHLNKLYSLEERRKFKKIATTIHLSSYTNTAIKVKGFFEIPIRLQVTGQTHYLPVCVIKDIANVPPLILGGVFLTQFKGQIRYSDPVRVTVTEPKKMDLETYFLTDRERSVASGEVQLLPGQTRTVKFVLHPANDAPPGTKVIFHS